MKYRFTVLLLLLAYLSAPAQSHETDSLKKVLQQVPADSNRVNTLIALFNAESGSGAKVRKKYAVEALDLAQKINFRRGEAEALNQLAYCSYNDGNELQSIDMIVKSLNIYQALGDNNRVAGSYNNIGLIYLSQDNTDKALYYLERAFAIRDKEGQYNSDFVKNVLSICSIYDKKGNDSVAMVYYRKAVTVAEKINDKYGLCSAFYYMGIIFFKKGQYQQAFEYQEKALTLARGNNSSTMQSVTSHALSEIYEVQHNYERALDMAKTSLDKAVQANSKRDIRNSYARLSEVYKTLDDYKNAYHYQSLYISLNDSLKSSEKAVAIEKIVNAHEVEKKELEIASITRVQKIQRIVFICSAVVLVIIGFLFYSRQKLIAEKKLALKTHRIRFYMQLMKEKSEAMKGIETELKLLKNRLPDEQVEKFSKVLQLNIHTDDDWEFFKKAFEEVYPGFFGGLRYNYPDITPSELRLSALIKLKLSIKESAAVLGISLESVKKARYRLRKKLTIHEEENLEEFIERISSGEVTKI